MKSIYKLLFTNLSFLSLFLSLVCNFTVIAQTINVEYQFNSATILSSSGTGSNCGSNDCGGFNEPDPRMNFYFGYNGGNTGSQYRVDRDGISCNSYQTCTTCPGNTSFTGIAFASTIYIIMSANEDDDIASGGVDGNCGALGTPNAGTGSGGNINAIAPCAWSAEQTSRRNACSSDGVTEDWGWRWQWRWSWNDPSLTDANAGGTISFSVPANATICINGSVSQLNGTSLLSDYFSSRNWQVSTNGGAFSNIATTQNYTPGAISVAGTYQYRRALTYCTGFSGQTKTVYSNTLCVVVFPNAPNITAPANVCAGTAFTLPTITAVTGFTVQWSINGTAYTATPTVPTTAGCHTIRARYVLTSACGGTAAGASGPTGCVESNLVSVTTFPTAPTITAPANVCAGTAFTLPTVSAVSGFTVQWSINGAAYTATPTIPTTAGCRTLQARYVLTAACGGSVANSTGPAGCVASNVVNVVTFPSAPTLTAPANVCEGTAFTLPSVTAVSGFTVEWSINGGAYTATPTVPTTPGCHTARARYVLTSDCGGTTAGATGPTGCVESNLVSVVTFPTAPSITAPTNVCAGTQFTLPTVTAVAGFNTEYSINAGTWTTTPTVPSTAGCHSVRARYTLNAACGGTAAGATAPAACLQSNLVNVVTFPAAPTITAPANVCQGTAFTLPSVSAVSGFTVQWSIDGAAYAASPSVPTTTGCHTARARYVLTSACGGTAAGDTGPSGCVESNEVSVVTFPTAPSITAPTNVCEGTAFTIPSVTTVSGFDIEYSIDGGTWTTTPTVPTTPACHSVRARYTVSANCGGTLAGATAPASCLQSNLVNVVTFPTAPVLTAPTAVCHGTAFTLPSVTAVSGFTVQWSINGAAFTASPTIPTTAGTYSLIARYVLTSACGGTAAGATGLAGCLQSNSVDAVISPLPIATPNYQLYPCDNTANLTATGISGGTTVSWQYVSGPVNPTGTTTSNPLLVTFTSPGTGVYNLLGSNTGCSNINLGNVNMTMPTNSPTTITTSDACAYCILADGVLRTYYSNTGNLMAEIRDNPIVTPAELGITEVCVDIMPYTVGSPGSGVVPVVNPTNFGDIQPYLPRRWTINPTTNTSAQTVTLYFKQDEYNALQNAAVNTAYEFSTPSELVITKFDNGGGGVFTNPPNFPATNSSAALIFPTSITRFPNIATGPDYAVTFPVSSFSTFYLHPNRFPFAPLPVELLSFTGWNQGSVNRLQWITASELNTEKFEIQKRSGPGAWSVIGEKTAAGNSNNRITYDFTDNNPSIGNNYYKLRIIDLDGTFTYSNVINVQLSEAVVNNFNNVYPNPTNGQLNVEIQSVSVYNTTINVVDILGKSVFEKQTTLVKGLNTLQFDFSQLAKSTYILQFIDNDGKIHSAKFVKD